LSRIMKLEYNH